jgi:hypothetical protein
LLESEHRNRPWGKRRRDFTGPVPGRGKKAHVPPSPPREAQRRGPTSRGGTTLRVVLGSSATDTGRGHNGRCTQTRIGSAWLDTLVGSARGSLPGGNSSGSAGT